ncbi:MAG TPA: class GN sortase [Alphaproteobacteria bacterium]|nr:class GN sortase [Alphaproteobacteria bacterium]
MIAQRATLLAGTALFGFGLWQAASGLYIHAKAILAQHLLDHAWQRTLGGTTRAKPWPWADTWPVARLTARGLDGWVYVLADASGRSLSFGPGVVAGTPVPGEPGNSVIAGHRDTHFRFLQVLAADDRVTLETTDGISRAYRIVDKRIVDTRHAQAVQPSDEPMLTLVTCYPFAAINPGGPLRYVVTAVVEE